MHACAQTSNKFCAHKSRNQGCAYPGEGGGRCVKLAQTIYWGHCTQFRLCFKDPLSFPPTPPFFFPIRRKTQKIERFPVIFRCSYPYTCQKANLLCPNHFLNKMSKCCGFLRGFRKFFNRQGKVLNCVKSIFFKVGSVQ